MDYSDLVKLGLLGAQDRKDAALMGLLNLGSQIGAASAPRTSPTPPPIDLSKAMGVYQGHMQNALTQGALKKKLQDDQSLRNMFLGGTFTKGMPTNLSAYVSQLGGRHPALAANFMNKYLSRETKEPKWHTVNVDGIPSYLTTSQLNDYRRLGRKITPIKRGSLVSLNLADKNKSTASQRFLDFEIKRSNEIQQNLTTSRNTIASLTQLTSLLDKAKGLGWRTGFGEELKLAGQKLFQTLGWTSERINAAIASKEAFIAESTKMLLPLVKMLGVNPTDKDLDFVVKGAPGIFKSVEGNLFVIKVLRRKAERDIARAEFDNNFLEENYNLLTENPINYRIKRANALDEFIQESPLWKPIVAVPANNAGSNLPPALLRGGG